MTKKIQLIIGSTRQHRISPAIAEWVQSQVAGNDAIDLEVIDLKAVNLPLFDEPTIPSVAPGTSEAAVAWAAKIASADAVIILASEYNAGYSAPLKNAIDYLKAEWNEHPVAIVSYGYSRGASAAAQLHQVFTRLNAQIIDSNVAIDIGPILNASGGIDDAKESLAPYNDALQALLAKLAA